VGNDEFKHFDFVTVILVVAFNLAAINCLLQVTNEVKVNQISCLSNVGNKYGLVCRKKLTVGMFRFILINCLFLFINFSGLGQKFLDWKSDYTSFVLLMIFRCEPRINCRIGGNIYLYNSALSSFIQIKMKVSVLKCSCVFLQ